MDKIKTIAAQCILILLWTTSHTFGGEESTPDAFCPANPPTYHARIPSFEQSERYAAKTAGLIYGTISHSPWQFLQALLAGKPVVGRAHRHPWLIEPIEHGVVKLSPSFLHYFGIVMGKGIKSAVFLKAIAGLSLVGIGYYVYTHWDEKSEGSETFPMRSGSIATSSSWSFESVAEATQAFTQSILAVGYEFASFFFYAKVSAFVCNQAIAIHQRLYRIPLCGPYKNHCMLALHAAEVLVSAPYFQAGMAFFERIDEVDAGYYMGIRDFNMTQLEEMMVCEVPRLFHDMKKYMAEKYYNNTIGLFHRP